MKANRIRQMLEAKTPVVNGWLSVPSSYLAEGVGQAGFDCVTVDLQHGMIGFDAAVPMLQALSATPAVPFVRAPSQAPETIMKLLDAGAYGVICPMISTAEAAERLVSACRYPPLGTRSFGPARGKLYGGPDYFSGANGEILVIPMIETAEALAQMDDILKVPGVDMVYIGPNDLALALGEGPGADAGPGATAEAIAEVLAKATAAGIPAGIFCSGGAQAQARLAQGFAMATPSNDFAVATAALSAAAETARKPMRAPAPGTG